jgi:hypothetical protein
MDSLFTIPKISEFLLGGAAYVFVSLTFFRGWLRKDYIDWHHLTEQKIEDIANENPRAKVAIDLAFGLFTAIVLSSLFDLFGVDSTKDWSSAVTLATWIWLGLQATNQFNSFLWEPTKLRVLLYNLVYRWLCIAAQAIAIWSVRNCSWVQNLNADDGFRARGFKGDL